MEAVMSAKSTNLYVAQVDALELLAKGDLEHTSSGWITAAGNAPVLGHPMIRSLANRGLCSIVCAHGRELAPHYSSRPQRVVGHRPYPNPHPRG
jgi:hypothetical protein